MLRYELEERYRPYAVPNMHALRLKIEKVRELIEECQINDLAVIGIDAFLILRDSESGKQATVPESYLDGDWSKLLTNNLPSSRADWAIIRQQCNAQAISFLDSPYCQCLTILPEFYLEPVLQSYDELT